MLGAVIDNVLEAGRYFAESPFVDYTMQSETGIGSVDLNAGKE